MTELAPFREQYSVGKAVILAALAGSGASTRGIHRLLQKLSQLTDTIGLNQQAALRGLAAEELAQLHATLLKIITNCTPTAPCA